MDRVVAEAQSLDLGVSGFLLGVNNGSPSGTAHASRLMLVLCGCGITVSLMHTLVAPLPIEISHTMNLSQDSVS